jgi:beta-phosphoglucomutase-like phosphatase (HAD superfamily)
MIIQKDKISAIIFDFDGTLVDTMPMHYRAYRDTLHEFGYQLTEEHFKEVIGGKASESIPKMVGQPLTKEKIEEIHRCKKVRVQALFEKEGIVCLKTSILLPVFWSKFPLALASAGSRQGIEVLLKRLGWRKYFDVVVTGEDVQRGKPAADAFNRAADLLGVAREECLVFEDTDAGVQAALNANMSYIDVRNPLGTAI